MSRDEIIERAARVLSTLTTCDGEPNATELHRRQAQALADAGLLAQPTDKIALDRSQELAEARGYDRGFHLGWRHVALDAPAVPTKETSA